MRHFVTAAVLGGSFLLGASALVRAEQPEPQDPEGAPPSSSQQPSQDLPTIPVPQPADAPPTNSSAENAPLETVIVTAQRRAERAQDVPISMTVLRPEQITNANMTNSSDLAQYTPSLSANTRFGAENATFTIRGFTQDLRTTASVGTYFAEVVAPRGQSSQTSGDGAGPGTLFDLQNVQILKGPQGTLFGRNTTGGAVLIVPNKPSEQFEGYVELSTGDLAMNRQQGVFNVPLTDWFKVRLSLDRNVRDGYLNNYTKIGADKLGNTHYVSGRASTVLNLGDSVENYTIASYIDSDTKGYSAQLFACNANPISTNLSLSLITQAGCTAQLQKQASTGNNGPYDIASTIATPVTVIKEKRFINTTSWSATDHVMVKNIVAYAHLHTENGLDVFGTQFTQPYDTNPSHEFKIGASVINPGEPVTSQKTWVEELQLQAQTEGGAIKMQTGAYYEHSLPDGFSGNNSAELISCNLASTEHDPSQFDCFDPTAGGLGGVSVQQYKTEYLNRAAYTQATFRLLKSLELTTGFRYTWDRASAEGIKTIYTFAGSTMLPPTMSVTAPAAQSKAPTGVVDLSYKPIDDVMVYAKFVRGYRQGSVIPAADPGIDTFKPEKVNTYEVGSKTTFEGWIPGRFNVALFYNDFTDQQLQTGYISRTAGQTTTIFNAGKSRIYGAEAEAYFRLINSLSLNVSYSYLNTRLLQQDDHRNEVLTAAGPLGYVTYTPIAVVGDELPFAPKQAAVATLTYRLPLAWSNGPIDMGATYAYTGHQRAAASTSGPYGLLESFHILNLNASWIALFATNFDLSFFATNVLNKNYTTYVSGTYNVLGFESRMPGQPRMFGGRLRYNFGAYAP